MISIPDGGTLLFNGGTTTDERTGETRRILMLVPARHHHSSPNRGSTLPAPGYDRPTGLHGNSRIRPTVPAQSQPVAAPAAKSDKLSPNDYIRVSVFELFKPGETYKREGFIDADGNFWLWDLGQAHIAGLSTIQAENAIGKKAAEGGFVLPKGPGNPGPQVDIERLPMPAGGPPPAGPLAAGDSLNITVYELQTPGVPYTTAGDAGFQRRYLADEHRHPPCRRPDDHAGPGKDYPARRREGLHPPEEAMAIPGPRCSWSAWRSSLRLPRALSSQGTNYVSRSMNSSSRARCIQSGRSG